MFWLYLKVLVSLRVLDIPSDIKYISRSQIYVTLYVLDLLGPGYTFKSQVYLWFLCTSLNLLTIIKSSPGLCKRKVAHTRLGHMLLQRC